MLCDTCKLEPFCNWEIPEYVGDFDVTKCGRFRSEPLQVPKGAKRVAKVLKEWLDKECEIDCDACALQDMCDVFSDDPAFEPRALAAILETE